MKFFIRTALIVLAAVTASFAQINVNSPGDGWTGLSNPVHVAAWTAGDNITGMVVYADGNDVYSTGASSVDFWLPLGGGNHLIVIKAWDGWGNVYSQWLNISVAGDGGGGASSSSSSSGGGGGGGSPMPSTDGNNFWNVQAMDSWQSCSVCAGQNGNGPGTPHYLGQWQGWPSLSGASAQFWVGDAPWGAALWWKQLGGNDWAHNLTYSLDFYLENPWAPQALEFDTNQNADGRRYIFGTECDIKGSHTWRVWNASGGYWASTGIYCPTPSAYSWNHLTVELQRVDGYTRYVSISLNGDKHYLDWYYQSYAEWGSGIDVAFQTDLDGAPNDYSVWLDNVTLSIW